MLFLRLFTNIVNEVQCPACTVPMSDLSYKVKCSLIAYVLTISVKSLNVGFSFPGVELFVAELRIL